MTIPVLLLMLGLAAALSLVMVLAWAAAERSGKSGWVDAIWSFAVGGAGTAAALVPLPASGATTTRQWLVAALVVLWSLRLGTHIVARTRGGGDDPRYAQLRAEWGGDAARRMFWFLQAQAAAALPLVISILVAARRPGDLGIADMLGLLVLLAAIGGEALADHQLAQFRADPANKGKVCTAGLWRWSRHPNYFFEWLAWVAYAVIAIDPSGHHPWGWLALGGPLLMYWLLAHVSGVPPLEAHMLRSRGEQFRAYQARTSRFFPWFPGVAR